MTADSVHAPETGTRVWLSAEPAVGSDEVRKVSRALLSSCPAGAVGSVYRR